VARVTRPGSHALSEQEELVRVHARYRALKQGNKYSHFIDSYKAEFARQAIAAGARMINDVWGGKMEPEILTVAAHTMVPLY